MLNKDYNQECCAKMFPATPSFRHQHFQLKFLSISKQVSQVELIKYFGKQSGFFCCPFFTEVCWWHFVHYNFAWHINSFGLHLSWLSKLIMNQKNILYFLFESVQFLHATIIIHLCQECMRQQNKVADKEIF